MTDFSKFLIASDLDGTFIAEGKPVARNLAALKRFRAGGGIFTLATGRSHLNLRSAIGEPVRVVNAPVICNNGAYLHDFSSGADLQRDLLSAADAKALLAFAKERFPHVRFSAVGISSIRSEENAGCVARDMPTYDKGTVCISQADTWPLDDWYKVLFLDDDPALLQTICEALTLQFGARFSPTRSSTWILEIQRPGVNKALGIRKLKKHLDSTPSRTVIACGDFDNDVAMLQAADVAVCPANAREPVKACAHHVLCHCREGLIADVIESIESGRIRPAQR